MKMKWKVPQRILSLLLVLVVVAGLLPVTAFAATEVPELSKNLVTYSDGVTQYYKYNNYLYKVAYTNLKYSQTAISFYNAIGYGYCLCIWRDVGHYTTLFKDTAGKNTVGTSDFPTTQGTSVSYYSTFQEYVTDTKKPVVTITCVALSEPTWNWSGTSSAKAVFAIDGTDYCATVNASVSSETVSTAANCLAKDQIKYTATATFNGKTYTTTKTEVGTAGPHDLTYSASGYTITETCSKCSNHTATATLKATNSNYTGSPITTGASVTYSDGWAGSKEHGEITYSNNTNAGDAIAKVTVAGKELTTTFKINAADISEADVTVRPTMVTYGQTAEAGSAEISVKWNDATLTIDKDYKVEWDKTPYNSGVGTYTATITGIGNFTGTTSGSTVVESAGLTNVSVSQTGTLIYDGESKTPTVTTTATTVDGSQVTFAYSKVIVDVYGEMPSFTDAGTYTVYYKASAPNHEDYKGSFTVTVKQAENAWVTEPTISGWIYGEAAGTPNMGQAKFGTVSVTYKGAANDGTSWNSSSAPTKAGSYQAVFTVAGTTDYAELKKEVAFTVERATFDMRNAAWDYTAAFPYDGKAKTVTVTGLPEGVRATYSGNTATDVGDYTASADLIYDRNNYNIIVMEVLSWAIVNNWQPTEYTVTGLNGDGWINENFVITPADGYRIATDNKDDSDWTDQLTFTDETGNGNAVFYLRNANDEISLQGTVSYQLDKTAPTGTIDISGRSQSSWIDAIIAFFTNQDQTVTITAEDELSGVKSVEYYESAADLTQAEVAAVTEWVSGSSVNVTAEDTKQFIYYARITDYAGNVTYLSSDGTEFDTTAPAITGVEDGKIYYTTQVVTVTDKNIDTDTITLNGEAATGSITLEGNKEATYIIEAKDKAGNSATVTVTMAPIADLTGSMEGKTDANVTSDDKGNLQTIVDTATELLQDADITPEEKEALENAKLDAQALLDTVEAAAKAADTENTAKVEDVSAGNVTLTDKSDLKDAKADLEKALEDNSGNYTEEEKQAIRDEIDRLDEALEVIEDVEAAQAAISQLPGAVEPDDEETVAKIEAAKQVYDGLTEYEKSLVGENIKKKLDDLTAAVVDYKLVKGDGSRWRRGRATGLSFTANGLLSKFSGIAIDGQVIDAEQYDAVAGSTVITLKASYLKSLSVGKHTITVVYADGEAEGTFRVAAKSDSPATGDDSNIMLYGTMLTMSLAALVVLLLASKKRKRAN